MKTMTTPTYPKTKQVQTATPLKQKIDGEENRLVYILSFSISSSKDVLQLILVAYTKEIG